MFGVLLHGRSVVHLDEPERWSSGSCGRTSWRPYGGSVDRDRVTVLWAIPRDDSDPTSLTPKPDDRRTA